MLIGPSGKARVENGTRPRSLGGERNLALIAMTNTPKHGIAAATLLTAADRSVAIPAVDDGGDARTQA